MKLLPSGVRAEAFFLNGTAGGLFLTYYSSPEYLPSHGAVIVLPPFAEEMNKSRRMMALQARALAAEGIGALIVDLYGTGDSGGDFEQARWEIWHQDVDTAISWLHKRGAARISAIGLRFGSLLAMDFSQQWEGRFERIVLWQPVPDGATALTQFLRTRWAASMLEGAREMESTRGLREKLQSGDSVEVAGYRLPPQLFRSIEGLQLASLGSPDSPPIHWLEVVSGEGTSLSLASQRVLELWRKKRVPVSVISVRGEPFWATLEISVAPEVIQATTSIFSGQP